jgi:hypothetical protein
VADTLPTLDAIHGILVNLAESPLLEDGLPAFLFRGERADYPNTLSTLDRHCRNYGLMSPVYEQLSDVADYAESNALHGWQLHPRDAAAFCQHYGLPTHMFDFTASAKVATFFSANRRSHKTKAKIGRVGILDVRRARANACAVFDLRKFAQAKRPQRQHGFGMMRAYFGEDDILDLKDTSLADSIGLRWVVFAHLPDDETFLHVIDADEDLLSLHEDTAARLPQDLVDQYVSENGPLIDEVARILSGEIPAIGRTVNDNVLRWSGKGS